MGKMLTMSSSALLTTTASPTTHPSWYLPTSKTCLGLCQRLKLLINCGSTPCAVENGLCSQLVQHQVMVFMTVLIGWRMQLKSGDNIYFCTDDALTCHVDRVLCSCKSTSRPNVQGVPCCSFVVCWVGAFAEGAHQSF